METKITPVPNRQTILSPCRKYRYVLWREWDMYNSDYCMFIALNPSTADEVRGDLTISKCIGFAKRWGFGALCVANLFAYRATDPVVMKAQVDPIGGDNDHNLITLAAGAGKVVAAWGDHGNFLGRDREVRKLLSGMVCLGKTRGGQPRHPSRLAYSTELEPLI